MILPDDHDRPIVAGSPATVLPQPAVLAGAAAVLFAVGVQRFRAVLTR